MLGARMPVRLLDGVRPDLLVVDLEQAARILQPSQHPQIDRVAGQYVDVRGPHGYEAVDGPVRSVLLLEYPPDAYPITPGGPHLPG